MKRFLQLSLVAMMLAPAAYAEDGWVWAWPNSSSASGRNTGGEDSLMRTPSRFALVAVRDAVIVEDNSAQAAKKTHDAIIKGAEKHDWRVISDTPALLRLELDARKHSVVVDVKIKGGKVDVDYVSSTNMNYRKDSDGQESIHPKYNQWISTMLKSAQRAWQQAET